MRLVVEHLTPNLVMLCNWPHVLATVELRSQDLFISPMVAENSFVVIPRPGPGPRCQLSMSSVPARDQIQLEVNSFVHAVVNLRVSEISVTFYRDNMFAIRIL